MLAPLTMLQPPWRGARHFLHFITETSVCDILFHLCSLWYDNGCHRWHMPQKHDERLSRRKIHAHNCSICKSTATWTFIWINRFSTSFTLAMTLYTCTRQRSLAPMTTIYSCAGNACWSETTGCREPICRHIQHWIAFALRCWQTKKILQWKLERTRIFWTSVSIE